MKVTGKKLPTEDPKRLRECLDALSKACGHDVYRCEMLVENGLPRVIITCSNEGKEEEIAKVIGESLAPWLSSSINMRLAGERYEYRIVDVCETLHMAKTGAGDGLTDELSAELIGKLKRRLATWNTPPAFCRRYDNAIRELILATLDECGAAPLENGTNAATTGEESE